MSLSADFALTVGTLDLDLSLLVEPGEVLTLLGPNGAGKTTALRALSGLSRIERGHIALGEVVLDNPGSGICVMPEARPVGVVFQDYLLFPHLSVLDNIAFGPRSHGVPKRSANRTASEWLDKVGLAQFGKSKPSEISGGQAQRVALARALATEPRLLLLDEPLAALDVTTRATVRRDLARHLADFDGVTVMVTHDPLDALALADHVVILEAGRVTQAGTIAETTSRPRTRYVADLMGVNLLSGVGAGHSVRLQDGARVATADAVEGETLLVIRPNSISLHLHRPESSARNQWSCVIEGLDLLGNNVRARLAGEIDLVAEITPGAVAELELVEGAAVWASVKATDIASYPA